MPSKCCRCGETSCVMYVKGDYSKICWDCEMKDREENGGQDSWEKIQERNRKRGLKPRG